MNQSDWQALAVLAAALAFVLAAAAIQRLLGWAAARREATARSAVPQGETPGPRGPVQPPADPEISWREDRRYDRPSPTPHASLPADRMPMPGAGRRARRLLRTSGGLKAAILVCEILGPPGGIVRTARTALIGGRRGAAGGRPPGSDAGR